MNIEQVRKALIEWESVSSNKENRSLYETRLKELQDLLSKLEDEQRIEKEESGKQALREVARELLERGMAVDQVSKFVSLPLEEIDTLKKSL